MQDLLNSAELKVTFEVDDLESAKQLISQSRWEDKLNSTTNNQLIFNLSPEEIAVLNKYFVENNISVSAVIPTRSLEEYFLKITVDAV